MKRFPWEWPIAIVVGFSLGLLYAWVISPVRYTDTTPDTLRADFKDQFRIAIAASYASTHDLGRAKARLALLGDADSSQALTGQSQRMLAAGQAIEVVQQVAQLAANLMGGAAQIQPSATATVSSKTTVPTASASGSGTDAATPSIEPPTIESTPAIVFTPTPRPTHTPVPTPGAPYVLVAQDTVCNSSLTDGLMQIIVIDSHNRQIPGAEIIISWSGGEEHFFSGLKPEIANGYADYIMKAGISYTVRVAEAGTPAPNLTAPSCADSSGQTYTGGLKLTFQQP